MNWTLNLNKLMDYIEENLENDILPEELANVCYISYFYLSRTFSMFTGITIKEYIRNRRLSKSVHYLISGDSIIDIALRFRYSTHESFSKAFKRFHGVTPYQVKTDSVNIKHFPKLAFKLKVEGETNMIYKIIEEKESYFIGKALIDQTKEDFYKNVQGLWEDAFGNDGYSKLSGYSKNKLYNSVIYNINPIKEVFSCLVGVEVKEPLILDGYVTITIPKSKFAAFEQASKKEEDVNQLKGKVFTEWITSSDYEFIPIAEIEYYDKEKDRYEYRISIK